MNFWIDNKEKVWSGWSNGYIQLNFWIDYKEKVWSCLELFE